MKNTKQKNKLSKTASSRVSPLFMVAQLPFNRKETVELNTPMIEIMDDLGNSLVARKNLIELGLWDQLLRSKTRFLEIGCGSGYLIEKLYREGTGIYMGLEPIASEAKKAEKRLKPFFLQRKDDFAKLTKSRIEKSAQSKSTKRAKKISKFSNKSFVTHGLLEEIVYPPYSIDCIYSYHVFEHLENPLVMFEKADKWLAPEGRLVITCPNVEGAMPQRDLASWRCSLSSHRWLPGVSTLQRAAKENGFLVERCFTYGGFPAPRSFVQDFQNWTYKMFGKGDVLCMMLRKSVF